MARPWRRVRRPKQIVGMPATLAYLRAVRRVSDIPEQYRKNLPSEWADVSRVGLTQGAVAAAAGVSLEYYRPWEAGRERGSRELIAAVCAILGTSDAQEEVIYLRAGLTPPPALLGLSGHVDIRLAERLAEYDYPGLWVSRPTWNIAARNESCAAHLPFLRPGANLARAVLGPHNGPARAVLGNGWPRAAIPMIEMLRMADLKPDADLRLKQLAASLREHRPVAQLWNSCADMRPFPDGIMLTMAIPTLSHWPVDVEISTLHLGDRPDLMLLLMRPVHVRTMADPAGVARSIPSAQALADANLEATGAVVVTVNYPLPDAVAVLRAAGTVDVRMRRAAIATRAEFDLPPGFLLPGQAFPPLPPTPAVEDHRHGGHVLLKGYTTIAAQLHHRPDLVTALIPGTRIGAVAHTPIPGPDGTPVGSVEAFMEGESLPGPEALARMAHLAQVRGAAMAREAAAASVPPPSPERPRWKLRRRPAA